MCLDTEVNPKVVYGVHPISINSLPNMSSYNTFESNFSVWEGVHKTARSCTGSVRENLLFKD